MPDGIAFPVKNNYVNLWRGIDPTTKSPAIGVVAEAAIKTIIYAGVVYGVYLTANK